ncbi:DNA polymerase eta [Leucoraja erinacea]|uniref:DNA polymerase eta n=1 Tax=Leucoraja erinaceus TaxID=7782 RepID=UPI002456F84E|nr:DNA polymerase eta [Leucoraja erinacea]
MPLDKGKERVVVLVDMDCFYVQVEQKANPELKGKPCAVVQYKTWQGGGIVAVSYEARAQGVKRGMRGVEAMKRCPGLQLARIPEAHGKANLSRYRQASGQVLAVLSRFAVIERASIDEVYADLTAEAGRRLKQPGLLQQAATLLGSTCVEGFPRDRDSRAPPLSALHREEARREGLQAWLDSLPADRDHGSPELLLTAGALIVEEMRAAVEAETGYRCSAGISHNKVLAKLSCGLNKPNRQTLLPMESVDRLFDTLPISTIRNLGGKLGESVSQLLQVHNMGELRAFSQAQLHTSFGVKTGSWLFDLCRGLDFEPVRPRYLPKSIGCSKNFMGKEALTMCEQVKHWLLQLSTELEERLLQDQQQNGRTARQLAVGLRLHEEHQSRSFSRCCPLARPDAPRLAQRAWTLIQAFNTAHPPQAAWSPPVIGLSLVARDFFETSVASARGITDFLTSSSSQSLGAGAAPNPGRVAGAQSPVRRLGPEGAHRPGTITSFFMHAPTDKTCPSPDPVTHTFPAQPSSLSIAPLTSPPPLAPTPPPVPETPPSPSPHSSPSHTPPLGRRDSDRTGPAEMELPGVSFFKRKALAQSPGQPPVDPPLSPGLPTEVLVRCARCGQSTLPRQVAEHKDFHFALDLQRSLSTLPPPSPPAQTKHKAVDQLRGLGKRARTGSKTLDWYFQKAPP